MKKVLTLAITAFIVSAYSAVQAQEFICDAKVGGAYATDQKAGGFNSALEAGVGINPYFELLAMPGFTWFNWDKGLGITKTDQLSGMQSELKASVNGYMFPILAGAKIKIADAKESIGIVPYLTVGAGYTFMKYAYEVPAYYDGIDNNPKETGSSTYKGFTWIALVGINYQFPDTNMSLVVEAGYRGAKLKDKDDFEADMSGIVANVGVSFAIGGDSY